MRSRIPFDFSLKDRSGRAQLVAGRPGELTLRFKNATDHALPFKPVEPSFPPSRGRQLVLTLGPLIDPDDIRAIQVASPGWQGRAVNHGGKTLLIISAAKEKSLAAGATFSIKLAGVRASGNPPLGTISLALYRGKTSFTRYVALSVLGADSGLELPLQCKQFANQDAEVRPAPGPVFYKDVITVPPDAKFKPAYPVTSPLLLDVTWPARKPGGKGSQKKGLTTVYLSMICVTPGGEGAGAITDTGRVRKVRVTVADSAGWSGGGQPQMHGNSPLWKFSAKNLDSSRPVLLSLRVEGLTSACVPGPGKLGVLVHGAPGFGDGAAEIVLNKAVALPGLGTPRAVPGRPMAGGTVRIEWFARYMKKTNWIRDRGHFAKGPIAAAGEPDPHDPNLFYFNTTMRLGERKKHIFRASAEGYARVTRLEIHPVAPRMMAVAGNRAYLIGRSDAPPPVVAKLSRQQALDPAPFAAENFAGPTLSLLSANGKRNGHANGKTLSSVERFYKEAVCPAPPGSESGLLVRSPRQHAFAAFNFPGGGFQIMYSIDGRDDWRISHEARNGVVRALWVGTHFAAAAGCDGAGDGLVLLFNGRNWRVYDECPPATGVTFEHVFLNTDGL